VGKRIEQCHNGKGERERKKRTSGRKGELFNY
jgi:hypothetical protein